MGFLIWKMSEHVGKSFILYIEMIYKNYQSNFIAHNVLFTRILVSFFLRKTTGDMTVLEFVVTDF